MDAREQPALVREPLIHISMDAREQPAMGRKRLSSGLIIVHPNLGNQGDLKKGDVEASLAEKENYTACDWTVKVAHASHSCTMMRFDFCTFVLLQRRDGRTCTEVNITSTRN